MNAYHLAFLGDLHAYHMQLLSSCPKCQAEPGFHSAVSCSPSAAYLYMKGHI